MYSPNLNTPTFSKNVSSTPVQVIHGETAAWQCVHLTSQDASLLSLIPKILTRSSENTTSTVAPTCQQYSETIFSSTEQCCTFTFPSHIVQIHQQNCNLILHTNCNIIESCFTERQFTSLTYVGMLKPSGTDVLISESLNSQQVLDM